MLPWIHVKQAVHMTSVYIILVCVRSADATSGADGKGGGWRGLGLISLAYHDTL